MRASGSSGLVALMSMSSHPSRDSRAPRRARPRQSLKMQAIGFLSRREHSRQELRAKLLESLRKRAREDAALAAADAAQQEAARARREQPSNGIDDAFAPRAPATATGAASDNAPADDELERTDPEAAVDRLLDWLAANRYLSDARFVENRI